jgi:hypothetical protein
MNWHDFYKTLASDRTELEVGFLIIFYFLANTLKQVEAILDTLRQRLPPLHDVESEF